MKWKREEYHVDVESGGVFGCSALMGIALFLRVMYYFGFTRTETVGFGELLLWLILPLMLEVSFMVLLRGFELDAPGLFGILGTASCLLLVLQCIGYDSILRMIFGIIIYIVCGGIYLAVSAGFLRIELGKWLLFGTAAVRIALDVGPYVLQFHPVQLMIEAAGICVVLGLGCFMAGLRRAEK